MRKRLHHKKWHKKNKGKELRWIFWAFRLNQPMSLNVLLKDGLNY
ncbi:MAG: hypothetical protein Q4A86_05655 [Clostridia bacterium]|nr:hypothetical protein [Clostridia bacterium]